MSFREVQFPALPSARLVEHFESKKAHEVISVKAVMTYDIPFLCLRNHHRGCGLCEQIKPSQRALARGLGCLLTKPKTKVMVPILTQLMSYEGIS